MSKLTEKINQTMQCDCTECNPDVSDGSNAISALEEASKNLRNMMEKDGMPTATSPMANYYANNITVDPVVTTDGANTLVANIVFRRLSKLEELGARINSLRNKTNNQQEWIDANAIYNLTMENFAYEIKDMATQICTVSEICILIRTTLADLDEIAAFDSEDAYESEKDHADKVKEIAANNTRNLLVYKLSGLCR